MSAAPRFLPRQLADSASLTSRLLGPGDPSLALLTPSFEPSARPGRLPIDAFGTSTPGVREKLGRVLAGEGFVVTTGHQPILFLGPLYVVYKALTIIELAAALEARLDVPVVPVFWVASDDHDWAEVGSTSVLDVENALHRLALEPGEGLERTPVGPTPLGPAIESLRDQLLQLVPDSEFKPVYLSWIEKAYRPGRTVSEAFASLLSAVLGERPFAWLDASRPELKEIAAGFHGGLLEDPEGALAAARAGARRIEAAGFDPQITHLEGALPLFYDGGEGRERLYYAGPSDVRAGREGTPEPLDTWRARLAEQPGRFSPNVESRPVLESWLLPVAATALGPGEIAYWGQLPELFDHCGVPCPAIRPRAAWTVLEERIEKLLTRFDLAPGDLADGGETAIARLTEDARPVDVEEALSGLRAAIGAAMGPVDAAVGAAFPGLKTAVGRTRKALFDAVGALDQDVAHDTRQRLETRIQQVERCAIHLYPGRSPQERVLNPAYYLTRYGAAFIDAASAATASAIADSLATAGGDG